ncbi:MULTISPECIES: TRAP transporter small permease [unclassified Nitratireductor]|uniref:TRAP transporter small permease n=1 Tax=unclassified Nitratireductor TaxID=2641084 RepID=UPI0025F40705|nr:TRAP transporter small permease [Nitratireductor sp.]
MAKFANLLITTAICLALAGMAASVFLQVVMRYALQAPPFWTEELARFLLIWLTFLGAVASHIAREHIAVEWAPNLLKGRWRVLLDIINHAIILLVLGVIFIAGFKMAQLGAQKSPALGISMRYIYGALPVGAALMLLVSIAQFGRDIASLFKGARDAD